MVSIDGALLPVNLDFCFGLPCLFFWASMSDNVRVFGFRACLAPKEQIPLGGTRVPNLAFNEPGVTQATYSGRFWRPAAS